MTVFITGAAGYVGAMLAEQFTSRDDVQEVVCLDKESQPDILKGNKKIRWITANTASDAWQEEAKAAAPTVVIHTAWQIRELYGARKTQWKWNVDGSDRVFDFAFETPSVEKLIYFSTVSSYGASPANTFEKRFTEDDPFTEDEYLYGVEKKVTEQRLAKRYAEERAQKEKGARAHVPEVYIVRPAAITGPRGRFMRTRFGLQAALSGRLSRSFLHRVVGVMVSFVPATPKWARQFIHEDDVADIVTLFATEGCGSGYEVFNICPPGDFVRAKDMARAVGKKVLPVRPWMVRVAFFVFWHMTRGRIPTSPGGWRFYSYPVLVDGARLTEVCGYQYAYHSKDAFAYTAGRYESYVPQQQRTHKAESA